MQKTKPSILSTALLSAALKNEALTAGFEIDDKAFIKVDPLQTIEVQQEIETALLQSATVAFTSSHAVEAVANEMHGHPPDWKIYCLANNTLAQVKKYFPENCIAAVAETAAELTHQIIENNSCDELIFFCGNLRRDELPLMLQKAGITVLEIIVYATSLSTHAIEKDYSGVLFFSSSSVNSFFLTNKVSPKTILFAIGNTTAASLQNYSNNKIIISPTANKSSLLKEAMAFLSNQ